MADAAKSETATNLETLRAKAGELLDFPLIPLEDGGITVGGLLAALSIVGATMVLARFLERRVATALSRDDPERTSSAGATARLVYYILLLIGITTALGKVGIEPKALFAAGAIFAVGLGFGLQNVVQNFVSGIILLGERVIKPGDILELDAEMVRVEQMGLRSTVARTLDEDQYIVPNQDLAQSKVKNYTLSDRLHRIRVEVGVAYHSDLPTVFEVLTAAATTRSQVKKQPPSVLLLGFGSSSIDFEVSIWTKDPWANKRLKSELALAMWRHLKDAGIEIAFPQLDIHIDQPLLDALNRRVSGNAAASPEVEPEQEQTEQKETEQQG